MQQPEKRGWWSRNWKWFVPVGCLSILAAVAVVIVLIVTLVFGALKSSDVYKQAMAKATANPTVISEIGQPIESGWMVSGSISVTGSSGEADISIPISGPKKSGTLYAVARKSAGEWKFSRLEVEVPNRPLRINLLSSAE
ncbi:MAG TPA: cytochrome c oxidase assembly factor Coa1 family protein [Blastocatellia bacterium]|jgi:hypothetical protein|nr:cytochrome c oxidase assembly factor Coa1 family protein [Blastocatellia bacterium]